MKREFRTLLAIAASLLLFGGAIAAHADTGRLGYPSDVTFNPTKFLTKTADYTVTTADNGALLNCTTSSANITATLPSLASVHNTNANFAIKLLKTDANAYTCGFAPATGDTIGGETARLITNQNGYIILRSSSGNNWSVDFESPYIVEDHEAGTTNIGTQSFDATAVFEGSTADAFETTLAVVDPTADATWSIPAATAGTYYFMETGLSTNYKDAANSVVGASNGMLFEGATADAFETTLSPQDPTADNTVVIPDDSGTLMTSTLATNGQDVANSVWGTSNGLIFEGATANAFETTLTVSDPGADYTATLPAATGTIAMQSGVGSYKSYALDTDNVILTTADCGEVHAIATDAKTYTLPATVAGCTFTFINAGSAGNNIVEIIPDAADQVFGTVTLAASVVTIAGAAGEHILNTKASSTRGNALTIIGDGADGWYITSSTGIWAEATP